MDKYHLRILANGICSHLETILELAPRETERPSWINVPEHVLEELVGLAHRLEEELKK